MSRASVPALPMAYLLLIVASLFASWSIPAYYDWTGADQSRPAPAASYTALGLILAATVAWLTLPWLPAAAGFPRGRRAESLRFSTRSLLVVMSAVAIGTALLLKWPSLVGGTFCGLTLCYAVWFGTTHDGKRLPAAALFGCMLLPFTWVATDDVLTTAQPEILRISLSLPALLPTAVLGSVAGQNLHDLEWLGMLLTGAELLVGIWVIRIGPKLTIAYLNLVLLLSTFGSFGLQALARM